MTNIRPGRLWGLIRLCLGNTPACDVQVTTEVPMELEYAEHSFEDDGRRSAALSFGVGVPRLNQHRLPSGTAAAGSAGTAGGGVAADGVDGVAVDGVWVAAGGARPSSGGWLRARFSRLIRVRRWFSTAVMAMVLWVRISWLSRLHRVWVHRLSRLRRRSCSTRVYGYAGYRAYPRYRYGGYGYAGYHAYPGYAYTAAPYTYRYGY